MDERIRALVARIDTVLTGVVWVGPASEEAIARVESTLRVRFPVSFRALLQLVGGGGVRGFKVSAVRSADPSAVQYGTVYGDTLHYRESWVPRPLPAHLVVVQRDANDNEPFCLDTSAWSGDECPVVLYDLRTGRVAPVAPDFLSFYERYLAPRFEAAG